MQSGNKIKSVIQLIKKLLSISSIILIVTAMLHFSVAVHYCGGMIASSKISLSGELATCGMENGETAPPSELIFTSHCCDNEISYYGVNGNYFPTFTAIPDHFQQVFQTLGIPELLFSNNFPALTTMCSESPPGLAYKNVDLAEICTFRI